MIIFKRICCNYQFLRKISIDVPRCNNSPSSSWDESMPKYLPYVEYVKSKFPEQVDEMGNQIIALNEERKKMKINSSFHIFFGKLSSRIINKNNVELIPVGSMITNLVNKTSDFDYVFFPRNDQLRQKFLKDFNQNPSFKQNFMSILANLISRECEALNEPIESIIELPRLRVPLITMRLKSGFSIDIQFPEANYHAVRNTHLIRCYKLCDERFTLLFLWLRLVSDKLEIRNSKCGLLSSYNLILLVVHFLHSEQSLSPWPVLPVLSKSHSNLVASDLPISEVVDLLRKSDEELKIKWESHNKMKISELILRFVDYYYQQFNPARDAIYIDKGLILKRKQAFGDVRLQIIDPYSPSSVCRSPHATSAFFSAISFMRLQFKQGKMLNTIPLIPEAEQFKRETQYSIWRLQTNEKVLF